MKKSILTLLVTVLVMLSLSIHATAQGTSAPIQDSAAIAKAKQAAVKKAALDSVNKLVTEKMQISRAMIDLAYDNATKEFTKYDFEHEKKTRDEFYREFIYFLINTWLLENKKEQEKKKAK